MFFVSLNAKREEVFCGNISSDWYNLVNAAQTALDVQRFAHFCE